MSSAAGTRRAVRPEPSVARQVLLTQVAVVVVLVVVSLALATVDARSDARHRAGTQSLSVARAVADSPDVRAAIGSADPTAVLQPYVEQVRRQTGISFVTVMRLDRTRLTHPVRARIGEKFVGDLGPAPRGGTLTQQYAGTLGPSVRSVVPVERGGRVVALVAVGITLERIDQALVGELLPVLGVAALVLATGLLGTWLVHRRLRRQTHGMGAQEITRMYEYYRAVLHAVREGLLLLDDRGRVQLVNDEAVRLLDLPDDPGEVVGRDVRGLGLPPGLVAAALGGQAESDDIYLAGEHVLVVSSSPATWDGRPVGVVVSLRDHTELRSVTGERDATLGLAQALRSQNHEAANRLHTMVSLVEMGRADEAVDFATEELQVAQVLTDQVTGRVGDPVVAAVLLGKSAQAAERGVTLSVEGDAPPGRFARRDLVTVLGNLVDNALDALDDPGADADADADADHGTAPGARRVLVRLEPLGERLRISVGDSGPGLDPDAVAHVLERGWTTKAGPGAGGGGGTGADQPGGRGVGLALVRRVARHHGGDVRVGRSGLGGAEFSVELGPEPA